MKLKKKILSMVLISGLSLAIVACESDNTSKGVPQQTDKQSNENISLDNLETYDDVKLAYDQNMEKIMNKEQLRELDMMNLTKDDVLEYAKKASEIGGKEEGSSDKIDAIDKLVTLNDLQNNTTQETMEDILKYIISEYETNKLQDANRVLEYQYLTKYLDKRLDNHTNMKSADEMIIDMYQICKDVIRNDNSRMDSNIEQVNNNIDLVKGMIK